MSDLKKALYGFAGILILLAAIAIFGNINDTRAADAQRKADILQRENVVLGSWAENLKADAANLRLANADLEAKLKAMPRRQAPPAPEPAPASDSELASSLFSMGLSAGVKVQEAPFTILTPFDGRKTYEWGMQAKRVGEFEVKSASDDQFIATQSQLIGGQKSEIEKLSQVVNVQGQQVVSLGNQAGELRKANEAQAKVLIAQKYKTRIVLGVSIPAALYVGWKVGRR